MSKGFSTQQRRTRALLFIAIAAAVAAGGAAALIFKVDIASFVRFRASTSQQLVPATAPAAPSDARGGTKNLVGAATVTAASIGDQHSCALKGIVVYCWGNGRSGATGIGSASVSNFPDEVVDGTGNPPLTITELAAGGNHTCALLDSSEVLCWGDGRLGQTGRGGSSIATAADYVVRDFNDTRLNGVTHIAAGYEHTCALLDSSEVLCWGRGTEGQLGIHEASNSTVPLQVVREDGSPLSGVIDLALGNQHSCALLRSTQVECWGNGRAGQTGQGQAVVTNVPGPVVTDVLGTPLSNVTQIAAGGEHTCGVVRPSGVVCWGNGLAGQLGNAQPQVSLFPVTVVTDINGTPLDGVAQIDLGGQHSCANMRSGEVLCWGDGSQGQTGQGYSGTNTFAEPVVIDLQGTRLVGVTSVAAGGQHTCAVTLDTHAACWGRGVEGQLGRPDNSTTTFPRDVVTDLDGTLF